MLFALLSSYFKIVCNRLSFTITHQFELGHCLQVTTMEDSWLTKQILSCQYHTQAYAHAHLQVHTHSTVPPIPPHTHAHTHTPFHTHILLTSFHTYSQMTTAIYQDMEKMLQMLRYILRSVEAWSSLVPGAEGRWKGDLVSTVYAFPYSINFWKTVFLLY